MMASSRPILLVLLLASCTAQTQIEHEEESTSEAVALRRVRVSVSPSTASVLESATLALTASISNTSNPSVTWTLVEGAAGGTLVSTGANTASYTAPSTAGTFHITATSVLNTSASGSAVVTVSAPSGTGTVD